MRAASFQALVGLHLWVTSQTRPNDSTEPQGQHARYELPSVKCAFEMTHGSSSAKCRATRGVCEMLLRKNKTDLKTLEN